jgi:hypothetical protein
MVNAWQTLRWMREGEAYLIVSAGGDGLFGRSDRNESPISFWLVIGFHFLISAGATVLGIAIFLDWV